MADQSTSPHPGSRSGSISGDANGYLLLTIPHARVNQVRSVNPVSPDERTQWQVMDLKGLTKQVYDESHMTLAQGEMR